MLAVAITPILKSQLAAEAWEGKQSMAEYVRGLLAKRGKYARDVGKAGGYALAAPPRRVRR
jgi:hypothetical protein